MTRKLLHVAAMMLALSSAAAWACGYCIEDRVAAVYDQKVVDVSARAHRSVAFLSVEGDVRNDAAARKVLVTALRGAGAADGATRVALASAACSLAFDPSRKSLDAVVADANRALGAHGLTVAPLRVIDAGGKLREP